MDDLYGPPLPPGYTTTPSDELSAKFSKPDEKMNVQLIGPALPAHLQPKLDDLNEVCGPSLHEFETGKDAVNDIKTDINKNALKMKHKLDNKMVESNRVERDEWMIVPDTSRKNQLGAISRCLAPVPEKISKPSHRSSEKDKKISEELKKFNKSRRAESLMDMHAKKLKKKSEKSVKKEERKAFDRDEMAGRSFTNKQVNSVIDKAKFLNSRFASSSVSKYL